MNKQEFINSFSEKTKETKKKSGELLETFLSTIEETLKKGEPIQFIGFGTFEVVSRKERTGINPTTKQKIKIPARKAVRLKVSKVLSEKINKK